MEIYFLGMLIAFILSFLIYFIQGIKRMKLDEKQEETLIKVIGGALVGSIIASILSWLAVALLLILFFKGQIWGISKKNFRKINKVEIRKTQCFIGNPILLVKWYKESNGVQHYFAVCDSEGYIDFSIQKTWLGKKKYLIHNKFKTNDIIKYINFMYDSENLSFEEILDQSLVINDEIKKYFLNHKYYQWDEFGLSYWGNYTGADMLGDRDFIRKSTLESRKKQILNKHRLHLIIEAPWICINMSNLSEEDTFGILIKKFEINEKFIQSSKAKDMLLTAYLNRLSPEEFAKKLMDQTIQETMLNNIVLNENESKQIINMYYLKLVEIIKYKFSDEEIIPF
ncbi:hypothetical protein OZY38_10565 [Aliarcobacter cryaerophilus]